ncbi:MAG: TolC family protein [Dissulfurimicrobium sp.]|uniref:TolC family protein n=1 Tax=Dissulfurimicrobium TaxID=1769732 RepID=UPI003C743C69
MRPMRITYYIGSLGIAVVVICLWFLCSPVIGAAIDRDPVQILSLRDAIKYGIQHNLDIKAEEMNIPIGKKGVVINKSAFDPLFSASISSKDQKAPASTIMTPEDFSIYRDVKATVGLQKRFLTGLESSLSVSSLKSMNNSSIDALRPQYYNVVVLDLTQPLLKDFGVGVNSAHIRISEKQLLQAADIYLDKAVRISGQIENAYYNLALAEEILACKLESRRLAQELLDANKEKFKAGLVPITEIEEAETAVASRDEEVIQARAQTETAVNNLLDLLGCHSYSDDPICKKTIKVQALSVQDKDLPRLDDSMTLALRRRPDLEAQRLAVESSDIKLKYYRNQRLPRLDLEATLGINGLSGGDRPVHFVGTDYASPLVGDYWDSVKDMTQDRQWYVGIRLSYPIGNRGPEARYRQADLEKMQAIYRLKRLEDTSETEVKNAFIASKRALERIKVAEHFENLAQITLSQEMERLKEGLSDTFHILKYQNDVIAAKIKKITAIADFNKGLASLYSATGTNLERYGIVAEIPGDTNQDEKQQLRFPLVDSK